MKYFIDFEAAQEMNEIISQTLKPTIEMAVRRGLTVEDWFHLVHMAASDLILDITMLPKEGIDK